MKTIAFVVAGVLAVAPALQARIERTVEKTFSVQPGGTLKVQTQGGNIRVEPGAGDKVEVVAREMIRANSEEEADRLLSKLELKIEQSGSDVSAIAKYGERTGGWFSGGWPPVHVSFTVKVPSRYNTDLHTSGGDVTVGDLAGRIAGRTSGGNVSVGTIDGEVNASTSGGNIALASVTGSARLATSGGNIKVNRVGGDADVSTSGGDIVVKEVAGVLHASTSGGNVSAAFTGPLKGDCALKTSGGDVRATVRRGVAFDLNASTSGGSVDAGGLTITLESGGSGKSRLKGKVNGGGPELKLRTSGGDVRIMTIGD